MKLFKHFLLLGMCGLLVASMITGCTDGKNNGKDLVALATPTPTPPPTTTPYTLPAGVIRDFEDSLGVTKDIAKYHSTIAISTNYFHGTASSGHSFVLTPTGDSASARIVPGNGAATIDLSSATTVSYWIYTTYSVKAMVKLISLNGTTETVSADVYAGSALATNSWVQVTVTIPSTVDKSKIEYISIGMASTTASTTASPEGVSYIDDITYQ